MNQAIEFPEREWWDENAQAVCFSAVVNGFPLTCAIKGEVLLRRFVCQEDELTCFQLYRWDLEEEAEQAIKQQREDVQGWVWLSSDK